MKVKKYCEILKKKSPTILATLGSIGTGVTAYLAARNEAAYQNKRFDYYIEHGMFPEELGCKDLSKDEIRKRAYNLLGIHLKQHISTFVSGALTITSILGGNAVGSKQNAALMAMNMGIGNIIAQRKEAENNIAGEHRDDEQQKNQQKISKEDIQDYLIREAYDNDIVYYTVINEQKDEEEFIWLDCYPANKIFIVERKNVNSLELYMNDSLRELGNISYGEIFDYLDIYRRVTPSIIDDDINEWIYMYGFDKKSDDMRKIEVYNRSVQMNDGTIVTALSFSECGKPIDFNM